MKPCIRVTKLSKTYHKSEVVKSISFDVEQGQIFAFLGPNGAGKSTTMNILSTLLEKSAGWVQIDGLNIDHNQKEIKKKIGVVFQNDVLDEALTVHKNLLFRGAMYEKNLRILDGRIHHVANTLNLTPVLEKKYGECSGGQRRLAQIGRALLSTPKLLILDEPTTGLDPVARHTVWQALLTLRHQTNMTVFFTTHYMEEALYADKYCILNHGQILMCDSMQTLKQQLSPEPGAEATLRTVYCDLLANGGAK